MRYLPIPAPFKLAKDAPKEADVTEVLDAYVWPSSVWPRDAKTRAAFNALEGPMTEACEAAKEFGVTVYMPVENQYCEVFDEVLKSGLASGPMGGGGLPQGPAARAIRRLFNRWMDAPSEDPRADKATGKAAPREVLMEAADEHGVK